jgi:hypothetical protein
VSVNGTYAPKPLPPAKAAVMRGRKRRKKSKSVSTTTENEEMKMSHIAIWTKTKMTKIYPRLAREKFGEMARVDENSVSSLKT